MYNGTYKLTRMLTEHKILAKLLVNQLSSKGQKLRASK